MDEDDIINRLMVVERRLENLYKILDSAAKVYDKRIDDIETATAVSQMLIKSQDSECRQFHYRLEAIEKRLGVSDTDMLE